MLYDSKQWIKDLDLTIGYFPQLSDLEGRSVLITGAAGLVCSAVTDLLIRYNETHNRKINIYTAGRWPSEMKNRFGLFYEKNYFHYVEYDAIKPENQVLPRTDFIIHGAGNASPDMIIREPVETMLSNFSGLERLLWHAVKTKVQRVLFISSSEVYGIKETAKPFTESSYGYIDHLNSRNSYSIAKSAAETLCVSFAMEYGIETVVVRPGHIYGPTASPFDARVSSVFAYQAARKEDLVMKSDGLQLRSYCYCLDCASAMLMVLLNGNNQEAYNISNPKSLLTIREMAELLAQAGGVNVRSAVASETEKRAFNPMHNSSLSSEKLERLNWQGHFDAKTGLTHTVDILREIL